MYRACAFLFIFLRLPNLSELFFIDKFLLQEKESRELQAKLEQGERRIVGLTTRLNVTRPRLLFVLLSS